MAKSMEKLQKRGKKLNEIEIINLVSILFTHKQTKC